MKKIKYLLITLATATLTLAAFINAASACSYFHYQPQLPQSLRK
jgi:cyclic lactone autoinducer peptide